MYSVTDYGRMLADRVRVDAYTRALAAVVRPGCTVVDLGAGTGFFALEACRLGAAKVYAIETNEAVSFLRAMAKKNGFADRIEVIARPSTEVALETKADVIVGDLRGVVPLFLANFDVMADARARLLAPGGVMIPERDILKVAVAHAPQLYASITSGWEGHGLDLDAARSACVSTFHDDRRYPVGAGDLVTDAVEVVALRYGDPAPELASKTATLDAKRAGPAHGLLLWFDAVLHAGIGFTTGPGSDRIYGRGFLPFERPVDVDAGQPIEIDLAVRRGLGDHVWAWSTTLPHARLRQSTFFGIPAGPGAIAKESGAFVPVLGARGRAVSAALVAMDGGLAVVDIARRIHDRHPGAFASAAEALEEVRRLARKYSEERR